MTKMAAIPIQGKNLTKIFFSGTAKPYCNENRRGLEYYNVFMNGDPVMTLTNFKALSM